MSLMALLDDHPRHGDEALIHTEHASASRTQFDSLVSEGVSRLRDAEIEAGQPVLVAATNSIETVAWMFAIWRVEAVYVPLNPAAPSAERDRIIDQTRPAVVVDGDELTRCVDPRHHESGAAFIMWTSGTTGVPKAVVHTHDAYLELLDRVLGPLRGKPADPSRRPTPNLIPVSLALNAGIYNTLFGLRAGAEVVIMERFEALVFARVVATHAIRSTVLPPAAMVMLNDAAEVVDLAPLKYVRSITAPLSPLQARRFTSKFPGTFVLNSYGQAEIGEVIGWTAADATNHPDKVGAAGRPHPGVGARVIDDDAVELAVDQVGQLEVLPPRRTESYASGESVDDRITADGYWRTGDLARIDADGFVWIEGRVGEVINRGGNKIYPDQVEEVLRLHPAVNDAAVSARADDRLGEVPVAHVVLADGAATNAAALADWCRDQLVAYKVPVEFISVTALPRNEIGKLLRAQLSALPGRVLPFSN